MKKNIFITSAGRRVSLVQLFQTELKKRTPEARVYCGDMTPHWSAACRISDGYFTLPPVTADNYIENLISLCNTQDVKLVIPTIDTELSVLSANHQKLHSHGIEAIISDHDFVVKCRDKRLTNALFRALGIDVPKSIDKSNPTFPCFLKPYNGSLSKGILVINNESEWRKDYETDDTIMCMEYLNPSVHQEFTVDAYYDRDGNLKCLVPRKRVEVRGGEVSKGKTERAKLYDFIYKKFKKLQGARGCITMQFFENTQNGSIFGIEINPRFGGGFPLSYHAGANYPGYIIDEYIFDLDIPFFENWRDNFVMLRYDAEVFFVDDKDK